MDVKEFLTIEKGTYSTQPELRQLNIKCLLHSAVRMDVPQDSIEIQHPRLEEITQEIEIALHSG